MRVRVRVSLVPFEHAVVRPTLPARREPLTPRLLVKDRVRVRARARDRDRDRDRDSGTGSSAAACVSAAFSSLLSPQ